ncbi:MAG: hypothetical protein AAGF11_38240 [Myxococcota bacterium]
MSSAMEVGVYVVSQQSQHIAALLPPCQRPVSTTVSTLDESDDLGQNAAGQVLQLPFGSWATVEFPCDLPRALLAPPGTP